jgi:methionyl aminopeptidase
VSIGDAADLEGLRRAGRIVRECLTAMRDALRPGITTEGINRIGAEIMKRHEARSAPMLFYGFPAETCISVNEQIVHGIPSSRELEEGDLVTLDVTVEKDGYIADAAITTGVGAVAPDRASLTECVERAFALAAGVASAGTPIREIGRAVETEVQASGFSVVRELCGHGVGRTIHEDPVIPNFYDPRNERCLSDGLVITIEPIITRDGPRTIPAGDGWTICSADGSPAAHYEQTLVITTEAPILLTAEP